MSEYTNADGNRWNYGLTERDKTSGLDHTWFRKHESRSGRWTSPDPYRGSISLGNPQSFSRYSYVLNDPVNHVDPSGLECWAIYLVFWRNGERIGEQLDSIVCKYAKPVPHVPAPYLPLNYETGNGATAERRPATDAQVRKWKYNECINDKINEFNEAEAKTLAKLKESVVGFDNLSQLTLGGLVDAFAAKTLGRWGVGLIISGTLAVSHFATADGEHFAHVQLLAERKKECKKILRG